MNNIQRFLRSFQTPYLQNKFLIESSRSLGSLPPNINYNGLLYTFVPEMQMFVNQYGHMISISQAAVFAEMAEFEDVSDIDDTTTDPGVVRRIMAERSPILAFAWSWPSDDGSDSTTVQNWIDNARLFEYVSPMVFITRFQANDDWKNGISTADKNAAYARLKGLSAGKRAIEPYSFAYTYWNYLSEGITGVSGSSTMFNDDGTSGVCAGIYANMWAEKGLSLGKAAWQEILNEISATGGSIDWVMSDVESGYALFNNFAIRGITGLINAFASNPNFTQTWYGVTSINEQMIADGVTVGNVALGPPNTDYVVWNKAINSIVTVLLDEVLWKPTVAVFPNVQGSNYSNFISGSSTDTLRDLNGHPNYDMSIFGSAASPVLYGVIGQLATAWKINPADTTQIIFGATTDPNYIVNRSPWNSFLLDIQNIRTLKRNSPNIPFTPWIASVKYDGVDQAGVSNSAPPPVGYADVVAGYNADVGHTFGSAGNSAYYYEMVRHACLYGTKALGYWNFSSATNGLTLHAQILNDTITDVNSKLGGFVLETADSSKVSWQTKQLTSGSPKTDGTYLWRTTIKPGTIYEQFTDNNTNFILSGTCVGTWYETPTTTPPDVRPLELEDIFYAYGPSSTDGSESVHGNGTPYAKWYGYDKEVVTTFQGIPYTGNVTNVPVTAGRAYEFEMDPVNPSTSSPWHNVMYEVCIDPYMWGTRSFYLSYPLGQIPQVAYPFNEVVRKERGVYTSTTDAAYSPARWKGFTSSIRGLLEGTLNPAGVCAAKSGFTAMSEPCNVMMYFQSTNGYWENRFGNTAAGPDGSTFYPGSLVFWDECYAQTGSTQGANDLYYYYVDKFVDEIISIKSPSGTAGVLSCAFDATTSSATPDTVHLFSSLDSYYTRGNSYELTDWHISQRLRAAGIPVYCEARPQKVYSLAHSGITSGSASSIPGICGATAVSQWTNHLSVEYWLWYSNPNNPVLGLTQDPNFIGFIPDNEVPSVFRWSQNTGPMPSARDPYKVPTTIVTGGTSYTLPYNFSSYITSPQKSLLDLYMLSDVYRKFNNFANTGLTFAGTVYDYMTRGAVFWYGDFAKGASGNQILAVTQNYSSLTGYYKLSADIQFEGNAIGYGSPTRQFNASVFAANPVTYTNNSGSSYGFWTTDGLTFWRNNVKQSSFNGFLNMLRQVSSTGAPFYGNTTGWAGATYPYDSYSKGIMPLTYRN